MTTTLSNSLQCQNPGCQCNSGTLSSPDLDFSGIGVDTLKTAIGRLGKDDAMQVLKEMPADYVKQLCIEGGKKTILQSLNEHAALIGATAAAVSVVWLIASSRKK